MGEERSELVKYGSRMNNTHLLQLKYSRINLSFYRDGKSLSLHSLHVVAIPFVKGKLKSIACKPVLFPGLLKPVICVYCPLKLCACCITRAEGMPVFVCVCVCVMNHDHSNVWGQKTKQSIDGC